jgi:hypothetical protein
MKTGTLGRIAAACIAAITWGGLAVQWVDVYREQSSLALTVWITFAFFTITTNLLVALVFTAIAADRCGLRRDWVVAGTMLSIVLVGVIYGLLLHGTTELSGGSAVANVLLHMVTPTLVPLYWLALSRKGGLIWVQPFWWAVYPVVYLVYALARGAATGKYAYPFLNVAQFGWGHIAVNVVVITAGFMASAFAVVWMDRRLGAKG